MFLYSHLLERNEVLHTTNILSAFYFVFNSGRSIQIMYIYNRRLITLSRVLSTFLLQQPETSPSHLHLWYSTGSASRQTVQSIASKTRVLWRALRGLEAGVYSTMTQEEFAAIHHEYRIMQFIYSVHKYISIQTSREWVLREANQLWYRYPLGESYVDVITRLEPVIFELERSRAPVLIVAHAEVIQCLYGYFLDLPLLDIPNVEAPLHELIELHTTAYECIETRHMLLPISPSE
jgi:broad specificity phosphatase PhoE